MKKTVLVLAFLFACIGTTAAQPTAANKDKTLYQRLGGYDAIAAVSNDFIGRLATGKLLSRFVVGLSDDSKRSCGSTSWTFFATHRRAVPLSRRDMKTVHTGLGINEADWKEAVDDLVATLDRVQGTSSGERRGACGRRGAQEGHRRETLNIRCPALGTGL